MEEDLSMNEVGGNRGHFFSLDFYFSKLKFISFRTEPTDKSF